MKDHNLGQQASASPLDIELDVVDIEEYALRGERPPRARAYRLKINGIAYTWSRPSITGREVLVLANLNPPENYSLRVKIKGEKPRKIDLTESVDLTALGVEKFKALPKDQTEGTA